MKELEYEGSLAKDIKKSNKKHITIIVVADKVFAAFVGFLISIPIFMGLGKLFHMEVNWAVSLATMIVWDTGVAVFNIFRGIKKEKEKAEVIDDKIKVLASRINSFDKDNNNLTPVISQMDIKNAVITKDIKKSEDFVCTIYDESGHTKSTKIETTNFFLLDSDAQLRILREIRETIKESGETTENSTLYLYEKEDIPHYVPVVRTLERK